MASGQVATGTEPGPKLRVRFLIRALTTGGAERQLLAMADGLRRRGHNVAIMVFYDEPCLLRQEAERRGVAIIDLGKKGRWDVVGFMSRLRHHVKASRCDVVYSLLPTSNVLAALAVEKRGGPGLVWGVRSTDMSSSRHDWLGRSLAGMESTLASRADLIVVNSASGIAFHEQRGLDAGKLRLVPNGIDLQRFRYDSAGRLRWRQAWGVGDSESLVVLAGRHDPTKGIEIFLGALVGLEVKAAIVGASGGTYSRQLRKLAQDLGLSDRLHWVEQQDDMAGVLSAADVVCSASHGEGTSNVLVEALACGTVIAGTMVGDTPEIVGDPTRLAAPGSAPELRAAILAAIDESRRRDRRTLDLATLARYDMDSMVASTEAVLVEALAMRRSTANAAGRNAR